MRSFTGPDALAEAVGAELGPSGWLTVDQARVDAFAAATDDEQWIHVDPARAAAGPFGGTIAHGYLTLSLLPRLTGELLAVDGVAMAVNYGSDRVRFLEPVPVGARLRATAVLSDVETTSTGVRVALDVTVEIEGGRRPALVARTLTLFVPSGR